MEKLQLRAVTATDIICIFVYWTIGITEMHSFCDGNDKFYSCLKRNLRRLPTNQPCPFSCPAHQMFFHSPSHPATQGTLWPQAGTQKGLKTRSEDDLAQCQLLSKA